jgi:hypothetical protein
MPSRRSDLLAVLAVFLGVAAECLAQSPSRGRTLEDLSNSSEPQAPVAASEAKPAESGPKRPAGTLVRPKDGVKHPDLDKAWAEYDVAVAKTTEKLRSAITKQFDAAAAKGDLDAAEKWQAAVDRFDKAGEVPTDVAAKAIVSAAIAEYKAVRDELTSTYEAVVKALTMEKKIAEAKAVRDELKRLQDLALAGQSMTTLAIPKDAFVFDNHSYYLFAEKKTHEQASAACKNLGGYLAKINTRQEQDVLLALAARNSPSGNSFWIDGTDREREGEWCFFDGTPLPPVLIWGTGQPDNFGGGQNGLSIKVIDVYGKRRAQLDDATQADRLLYLCEWDEVRK